MPFTPAHPAAVLPVLRFFARAGVGSALVIGSMTPDFAYFVPWPDTRHQSHTLPGLLSFCLPAGLLAVALYEGLLRRPLTNLLPAFLRARIPPVPPLRASVTPGALVLLAPAILLGALTHQVWDSFTHANGVVVDLFPLSKSVLFNVGGYHVAGYKVFQHASTLLGSALVIRAVQQWCAERPRGADAETPADGRFRVAALLFLALTPLLFALWAGSQAPLPRPWGARLRAFSADAVVAGGQALALATLAYCVVWWARQRGRQPARRSRRVDPGWG